MSPLGFCIRYLLAFLKARLLKLIPKKKKKKKKIVTPFLTEVKP